MNLSIFIDFIERQEILDKGGRGGGTMLSCERREKWSEGEVWMHVVTGRKNELDLMMTRSRACEWERVGNMTC